MQRVDFVRAYSGSSLHQRITNRGLMEETHRLVDLLMPYERVVNLRTRETIGKAKHLLRRIMMFKIKNR